MSNNYFGELMQKVRLRFGVLCVESKNGYRTILKLSKENINTLNIIIGDQSPGGNSSKQWVDFLQRDTAFLIGADRIAKKGNHAVVFPSFKKIKRGQYEITFTLIEEFPKQCESNAIIDKYAKVLEETIQASPELWLWSHRRWKLTPSTEVNS